MTPEQQAVVADRSRDILVSAGAGSGKTRVLVERYLSLLAECRIPEIAAVTFTDAAATEMRDRVRRAVHDRPELAGHRCDLDQAVIGTLHALCRRILHEHPVPAGTIAAGRVLADDEAEHERIGAAMDALEDAAQSGDGRARALQELGAFQITEQLPRMIERRDEVQAAFAAIPGATVDARERYVRPLLDQALRAAVDVELPNLERAVDAIRQEQATAAAGDALEAQVRAVLAALGSPLPQDPEALVEALSAARPLIRLGSGSKRNWQDLDRVKADLRTVREIAQRLEAAPRWEALDRTALEATEALRAVFDDACRRYQARKAALGGCDYLDLEIEAIRLLRGHPAIAAGYRRGFRHVMVDEVQDVNEAQITLLELLTGGETRPNLFLVGDAKQAIYRFRGSDVAHFIRFREQIERDGGGLHSLTRSFRTHDELVQAGNDLFEPLFATQSDPDGAGPDWAGRRAVPMQRMTGRGPAGRPGPHLIVIPVDKLAPDGAAAGAQDRRRVEADAVAREIAALLRDGHAPRDVAILLRRLANVHAFEQALESHGVPYGTPAGAGFFTRQEVRDLINLLAWLAEPDDGIALAGALRSPLFMLDDRTLLRCHAAGPGRLRALLREPPDGVAGDARRRCLHAAAVLDELRSMVPLAPADKIAERALELTGFEAAWAAVNGGEQALANVRKLVAITRDLAGRSIDEVVDYLRRRRDELADREGLAVIDQTDAVRILTIHGAKGLEFPIVFVPEAHVRPPERSDPVLWRPTHGIAVTLVPGALGETRRRPGLYRYLRELDRHDDAAEYRRLLYVAATRAADRLYLSGEAESRTDSWLAMIGMTAGGMDPNLVDVRPPVPVDVAAIAVTGAAAATVPPAAEERPVTAPLVERPAVIPLRSSTPVTALRRQEPVGPFRAHGDRLGLMRGSVAHEAIRLWFTAGRRPELMPLLQRLQPAVSESERLRVRAEVEQMLDRLDGSELAQALRRPGVRPRFELPFGWYWDGAPVHGTIDLAYRHAGRWHLVDFKTDKVQRGRLAQAAAPYLGQVALYAGALQQAVGHAPVASLYFLRSGDTYVPDQDELRQARAAIRSRIDAGELLADTEP